LERQWKFDGENEFCSKLSGFVYSQLAYKMGC